ncbi:hypothetical protein [Paucisalibacillus sp. EB02]|uniref:hypothetical protein n=1 Tax=Paucisalibacillus sp. EB02 TaxID=1347087 RepID=UPI0004B43348|nr:hypothetical protein [Paucisalibacillus sp. EB02]
MDFLSWHDFIQPTNPIASIFFGLIFAIIVTLAAWFETREKKTAVVFFAIGIIVVIVGVVVLNIFGYYK